MLKNGLGRIHTGNTPGTPLNKLTSKKNSMHGVHQTSSTQHIVALDATFKRVAPQSPLPEEWNKERGSNSIETG